MIELQNVSARFGSFLLREINLRVATGQYCVLLGPPGSGKTSIVELICGLRRLAGGTIALAGRRVDRVDPADRHVGYVPQDYALFPTLNVFANIAFGLKVRHIASADVAERVAAIAARLGIGHLLKRSCRGLSGGERQRVALARALVLEPRVLLLDEPVSALDESTRQQICLELRSLHDSLGMTTIHVSHNFEETRSVADLVGVLRGGRLVQAGTVEDIFRRPACQFVARFVQAGNILRGQVASDRAGCVLQLAGGTVPLAERLPPGPAAVLLRPQDATIMVEPPAGGPVDASADRPGGLAAGASPGGRARLPGVVVAVLDGGGCQVTVRVRPDGPGEELISAAVPRLDDQPVGLRAGQRVAVTFDPARLRPLAADDLE